MGKRGAKVRLTFFGEQDFSALYGSKQHHIPVAHLALAQINARRRVKTGWAEIHLDFTF